MRSAAELAAVQDLLADGLNDCEIARLTTIPRETVRDWRRGRTPRQRLGGDCSTCGGNHTIPPDAEAAYCYLLGLYLGDGHIAAGPRGVFRLRIFMDQRYSGIVSECANAISTLLPANRVGIHRLESRAVAISAYSKGWPCLFPQHGPGPKHSRPIELTDWQRALTQQHACAFLRGLIHSDGSRFVNTVKAGGKTYAYPRYNFTNNSDDIRRLFCEHLDLLAIPWRRMNGCNISVARREAVARLDEFIGPKR